MKTLEVTKLGGGFENFLRACDGDSLTEGQRDETIRELRQLGFERSIPQSLIKKVIQFGRYYPDYLTQKEIEKTQKSYMIVQYLDLLAAQRDANVGRQFL